MWKRTLPLGLAALFAAGCTNDLRPPTAHTGGGPGPTTDPVGVAVTMLSAPRIGYDPTTGKTTVVLQLIARDRDENPLGADDLSVVLRLDGRPLDNESILEQGAAELASSVHLGLVLDASYSMLQHDPPAFVPMLEAARNAIAEGQRLWAGRPGTFTWRLVWFNEGLFSPRGTSWAADDLLTIPAPNRGTATKLFAASEYLARTMGGDHGDVANGPNDHHVLVVFSDGADNYSWFDNQSMSAEGTTSNGSPYLVSGYPPASIQTARQAIEAHPRLTSHVIGLGSKVRDEDLRAIAAAGEGRYFKNLHSSEVGALFAQVVKEFATIQDHGATIPLPPGDYTFELTAHAGDGSRDAVTFRFHAGDAEAGLLD